MYGNRVMGIGHGGGCRGRQVGREGAPSAEALLVAGRARLPVPARPAIVGRADKGNLDTRFPRPVDGAVDRVSGVDVCPPRGQQPAQRAGAPVHVQKFGDT